MKLLIVVGARPNFMKVAPILRAIHEWNGSQEEWVPPILPFLVHTGQHYDAQMSDAFFSDLDLPHPDAFLGVGSGSHAAQTAEVMKAFEPVLLRESPDVLLVVGDVNSTLACALVAAKLPGQRPLIAHVEAGLRSFDRSMPEEVNRILTDHISYLLFVSEKSGLRNLEAEGIAAKKIYFVGNTMIDSLRECEHRAESSSVLERLALKAREFMLLTLHRAANVDDRDSLIEILEGLGDLAASHRIIFPAHPRTEKQIRQHRLDSYFSHEAAAVGIHIVKPQGYLDFLCLMKHARLVVTDSGGIQEETTALRVPCVTVRDNTERPVTIELGTNLLAGTRRETIRQAIQKQMAFHGTPKISPLWDGKAASRIVKILADQLISQPSVVPDLRVETGQIQENTG